VAALRKTGDREAKESDRRDPKSGTAERKLHEKHLNQTIFYLNFIKRGMTGDLPHSIRS
jgi:hypothetical protein